MNAIARPLDRRRGHFLLCVRMTKLANTAQKTGGTSIKIIS